jgi:cardiolipin synthase C
MPNFSAILPWYVVAMLAALLSSGCASLPTGVLRPVSTALAAPETTPMGQWVQNRKASAGARSNSAFFLLETEELALSARVALVDGARKTLDLQYYAIHADASTETVLDRLRSAAQRGVRVRLLLDDLNTVGRDAQVLRLAFEPNVQIRLFNPIPGHRASLLGRLLGALPDISRLQKRMHNKLFLADNALGIIGGRNLGDAYCARHVGQFRQLLEQRTDLPRAVAGDWRRVGGPAPTALGQCRRANHRSAGGPGNTWR